MAQRNKKGKVDTSILSKSQNSTAMMPLGTDDSRLDNADPSLSKSPKDRSPGIGLTDLSSPKKSLESAEDRGDMIHRGIITNAQAPITLLKSFYKMRGWSLVLPFLSSLFIAFYEGIIDARSLGFGAIACFCFWSFVHMKSLESRRNYVFIICGMIAFTIWGMDFSVQFGLIGSDGWPENVVYYFCHEHNDSQWKEQIRVAICNGFKMLYYVHGLIYLGNMVCFVVFIYATYKLLTLTNYVRSDATYRIQLEEEIDDDENQN